MTPITTTEAIVALEYINKNFISNNNKNNLPNSIIPQNTVILAWWTMISNQIVAINTLNDVNQNNYKDILQKLRINHCE